MIHETLPGGLLGAVLIFGGVYVGIVAAGSVALVILAKVIPILQQKLNPAPASEGETK